MFRIILAFILFVTVMSMGRAAEFKVHYIKLKNFKAAEVTKVTQAASIIETIINSQEFKERVVNHVYMNKRQFVDTTMTNEQVYQMIMLGAEKFYNPIANGQMDISLEHYYSRRSTIGYTLPNSDTIWLNRKYHDKYTAYDQTANLVHEWTHKLGFEHAKYWSKSRDYSVPYGVGSIIEELSAILKANPNGLHPVVK